MTNHASLASLALAGILTFSGLSTASAAGEKIRVGYWASGVSAGLGYVLEKGKFLEKEGLQPEWTHFTKLAGVNRALASRSIDVTIAAGTIPGLRLASEDSSIKIVMATMIADANFVVRSDSPIKSITDLKGKKIGSTPPGSTAYGLVSTILEKGYGFSQDEFKQVPASGAQIAVFLRQGEIDAGLMRTITYRTIGGEKAGLRIIATVPDEWKKLTKSEAPPILGIAAINTKYAKAHNGAATRFLVALIKATKWGADHPNQVAKILQRNLNMDHAQAMAYAQSWKNIYLASLDAPTIDSIMKMANIFEATGALPGKVSRDVFDISYYEKAMALLKK